MERNIRDRAYNVWKGIKARCYNKKCKDYKSYGELGITMCEEWLDFKNFLTWYEENYYEVDGEYMAVDKDIIGNGSKVYSPETCLIVPFRINGIFVHKDNGDMRGLQTRTNGKTYSVKVRNPFTGKNDCCGTYKSIDVAKEVYRKCKKEIIIGIAEEYKEKIPFKLYDSMINFTF